MHIQFWFGLSSPLCLECSLISQNIPLNYLPYTLACTQLLFSTHMMEAARTQHHIDSDWKRTGSPLRNTKIQHWRVKCAFLEAMASKTTSYELTGLRSVKQHETFVMMSCQPKQNLVVSREFMTAPRRLELPLQQLHCPFICPLPDTVPLTWS